MMLKNKHKIAQTCVHCLMSLLFLLFSLPVYAERYEFTGYIEQRFQQIDVFGSQDAADNFEAYNTDKEAGTSFDLDMALDFLRDGDKRYSLELCTENKLTDQLLITRYKRDQIQWQLGQRVDIHFSDLLLKSETFTGFLYNYEYQENDYQFLSGMIGDTEQKGLKKYSVLGIKATRRPTSNLESSIMAAQISDQGILALQNIWKINEYGTLDIQAGMVDTGEVWLKGMKDSAFRSKYTHTRSKLDSTLEYYRVGANYVEIENVNMENDIDKYSLATTYKFRPTTFLTLGSAFYHDKINNSDILFTTNTRDRNMLFAHMPGIDLGYLFYGSLSDAFAVNDQVSRTTKIVMNRLSYTRPSYAVELSKMMIDIGDRINDFSYDSDRNGLSFSRKLSRIFLLRSQWEVDKIETIITGNSQFTKHLTRKYGFDYFVGKKKNKFAFDYSQVFSTLDGERNEEKKVYTALYEHPVSDVDSFVLKFDRIRFGTVSGDNDYDSDDYELSYRRLF